MTNNRKFIESFFPIRKISIECKKEQDSRRPTIADLHLWWARRPIAASRSTIFSSLISNIDNLDDKLAKAEFIVTISKLENFNNLNLLKKARKEVSMNKSKLKVLDPFSGGGSIPFECMNLGCDSFACDYNPVSFLILKSIMEFPQKFSINIDQNSLQSKPNSFLVDYARWCDQFILESEKQLKSFFMTYSDGYNEIACIRAHCLKCHNPICNKIFPLVKQFWLSRKKNIAFYIEKNNEDLQIRIIGTGYNNFPDGFNPSKGTIKRGIAECPYCKSIVDAVDVKNHFLNNTVYDMPLVIVTYHEKYGKKYRTITEFDKQNYKNIENYLNEKQNELRKKWNIEPIPNEPVPPKNSHRAVGSQLPLYGIKTFGELFNPRQTLVMLVFTDVIREIYQKILKKETNDYAMMIVTYLALIVSKHASYNSKLCWWEPDGERVFNVFGRQTFAMVYDYSEQNPFGGLTGNISKLVKQSNEILQQIIDCKIDAEGKVIQTSALRLPFSDGFFDAVFTDPPYYDNIPYSYLSDFFYVWLKRSIGYLHPANFSTPLTPKSDEIVVYQNQNSINSKELFEKKLAESFKEIYRVLKSEGVGYIVYTHKSNEGWESLINSILESGFVVTASLPINTEMTTRLGANDSASLSSSIYMIIRKHKKLKIGFYKEIKLDLKQHLNKKLEQLWKEGISGADFFIAAIGSAIEVFGKYERVVDDSDNPILIPKLLDDTREIVTNYAIKQVLHSDFSDQISLMTRFYILWRWAYGEAKVPFDDARKMAQSVGIDLEKEWNKGFITKDKEHIRVLGPDERDDGIVNSHELIDILHLVLLLWKNKKKDRLEKLLKEKGYDKSDVFKRVAQAISESLPQESTEKRWLDGFLTGFRIDNYQTGTQAKLF